MSRTSRTGGERLKRYYGSHRANNAIRKEIDFHFYIPVTQARPTFGAAASMAKIKMGVEIVDLFFHYRLRLLLPIKICDQVV
ncbi:hypothetical protein Bpfe_008408 [Biomphalaria pfeifferi]|uniref:Uncharacterized protein n=1 Tax=Biomphalaria pfeifferi TaxID=112525 RepID=A0AAD8BWV4_BIOPF|nr:hypothetical protein Bpfe_008408 [Biomphalaria pfeifferi]